MDIKRILYATDFSEQSEPALHVAASLARDNNAKLTILHVSELEDYPVGEHVNEEPTPPLSESRKLQELTERVEGAKAEWRWVHGESPHQADAIISVAKKENADIIVIGSHGGSGLMHVLMGSVAEKVIREAPCPVLSVRHIKPSINTV